MNKTKPFVTILMSIYNGEKFLREQIDSIIRQEDIDFQLVIRDDGSTDSSLSLLDKLQKEYNLKFKIIKGPNIGWMKSFRELIEFAAEHCTDCNYFAFADQDDIWLPEKLASAVKQLCHTPKVPSLYFSNLFFYQDGKNKGIINHSAFPPTYKNCLARNCATGCTIVFNHPLLELLSKDTPNMVMPHDQWAYMVAVLCGEVYPDPKSYILYRQHSANQIGGRHGMIDVWKRRFKTLSDPNLFRFREQTAKELLRIYRDDMRPEAREAVEKMAFYRSTLASQLRLLFDNGYTLGNIGNDFFFKLRILSGRL